MNREYPANPIIGVGGVIVHQGRVLLVRRGRPPLMGEWSIPGGALETGETLLEALRREMREETGLEVRPVTLLEVLDRIIRDEQGRARYHYVLIDYLCTVEDPQACAASDALECRWVEPGDWPQYGLWPDTLQVLEKGLKIATLVRKD